VAAHRKDEPDLSEVVEALKGHGTALSQLVVAMAQQKAATPTTAATLAPWAAIAVTLGTLIAGGSYFISQRPTVPVVEQIVDTRQKPIAAAVEKQTAALEKVATDVGKVRETQLREEGRRAGEAARPVESK
jgi:hypothetical protein